MKLNTLIATMKSRNINFESVQAPHGWTVRELLTGVLAYTQSI